jgi:hypothetical protein
MKVKKRSFKALHKLRSGIVDLKRLIAVLPRLFYSQLHYFPLQQKSRTI